MKFELFTLSLAIYSLFYGAICWIIAGFNGLLYASILYLSAGIIGILLRNKMKRGKN